MSDPFEGRDHVEFETYDGKRATLSRETWAKKVAKHSEQYLAHNFAKVKATLADPDSVVRSKQWDDTLLYFKQFTHFHIREDIEVPSQDKPYLLVVVKQGWLVQSIYRVKEISKGEAIWPR